MNIVSYEPVVIQALTSVLVWVGVHYGLKIDEATAGKIALGAFIVGAAFVRQLVRPTVKDQAPLTAEEAERARALLDAYQPDQKTVPPRV